MLHAIYMSAPNIIYLYVSVLQVNVSVILVNNIFEFGKNTNAIGHKD